MKSLVFWEGKLHAPGKVRISPVNSAFFYGENIFEAIPVYGGKPLFLQEHLLRLQKGCCFLKWSFLPETTFMKAIRLFTEKEGINSNFMIRFNLSQDLRGNVNPRDYHAFPPTLFATIRPLRHNPSDMEPITGNVGIGPWTAVDEATIPNHFKIALYMTTRKTFRDHPEWDEIVRLNSQGEVVDGGLSTPFWNDGKKVWVSPLRLGGLQSVTREKIMRLLTHLGIKVVEKPWKPKEVSPSHEVFFGGSGVAIMAVSRFAGLKFKKPPQLAPLLWQYYRGWIRNLEK